MGAIPAFTRKLMVSDPACSEAFLSDGPSRTKRKRDFSYSGACAAARSKRGVSELLDGAGQPVAVVVATPRNRSYPVYALVRGKKVLRLVIVFDGDPCREVPKGKRSKKRGF